MKMITKEEANALVEQIREVESIDDYLKLLDNLHPSDAYDIIKQVEKFSNVERAINMVKNSPVKSDIVKYQTYQDICQTAEASHKHDITPATMLDVDKAVSAAYGVLLRMIKEVNDVQNDTIDGMHMIAGAINRIEEKLGLELTDFGLKDGEEDDTTESGDEQGCSKNTDGTGHTGE